MKPIRKEGGAETFKEKKSTTSLAWLNTRMKSNNFITTIIMAQSFPRSEINPI